MTRGKTSSWIDLSKCWHNPKSRRVRVSRFWTLHKMKVFFTTIQCNLLLKPLLEEIKHHPSTHGYTFVSHLKSMRDDFKVVCFAKKTKLNATWEVRNLPHTHTNVYETPTKSHLTSTINSHHQTTFLKICNSWKKTHVKKMSYFSKLKIFFSTKKLKTINTPEKHTSNNSNIYIQLLQLSYIERFRAVRAGLCVHSFLRNPIQRVLRHNLTEFHSRQTHNIHNSKTLLKMFVVVGSRCGAAIHGSC